MNRISNFPLLVFEIFLLAVALGPDRRLLPQRAEAVARGGA